MMQLDGTELAKISRFHTTWYGYFGKTNDAPCPILPLQKVVFLDYVIPTKLVFA